MDLLEEIWDAPVQAPSPPRPLFFQGSDDEEMPDAPPRRAEPLAPEVQAVLSVVDDLFDGPGDDSHAPTLTPHQILSSSPAHHLDGDDDKGKDKDTKKPKKKVMRLDEGRLVGPSGFPQLIEDAKNIKIKGKGHEASDLNRLLQVYQFWTHRLYPKTPFKDTVDRVEKICHSKRMHNMLSVWRDEARGIVDGKKAGEDEDDGPDAFVPGPESDQADYASSSDAATRPPSSTDGEGDPNESDVDMRAMDAAAKLNAQHVASVRQSVVPREAARLDTRVAPAVSDEDNEEEWGAVEAAEAERARHPHAPEQNDDDEMWAELDDMDLPAAIPSAPPKHANPPTNDFDEDWNLLDEIGDTGSAVPNKEGYGSMSVDGN